MSSDDYPRGYFESAEGSNYVSYGDDPGWRGVLNAVGDWFRRGDTFIEMACAKGWFVREALMRGYDAVGFDISEYAISKAAPGTQGLIEVHNAASPWPYTPRSAHAVFGFEFLEHVPENETWKVLDEAFIALKPGGRLILKNGMVVEGDHPFAGQEDHDKTHVNMKTRAWWEQVLPEAGFCQSADDLAIQASLDAEFKDRDWFGRWFVWHKPA
jgi:SAM-dependent methyltransferase